MSAIVRETLDTTSVDHGTGAAWYQEVEDTFRRRTPNSLSKYEQSRQLLPGGSPGGLGYMRPYPLYISEGRGSRVWDADGNEFVDFFCADWLQLMGHGNPAIVEAVRRQVGVGSAFGQPPADLGFELAALLASRIPSIQRMRFTTSGSEATQAALRLARAFTGRSKIAKMRGGYHGTHDASLIANGRFANPDAVPPGLLPGTADSVLILPFNHAQECVELITANASDLAAVIVEPILGGTGMVPATTEFLHRLRSVTEQHGILLILDEVVTFPVGPHGAQGYYDVRPDLTTFGKAIGGGTPLGAFGGRADIVDMIDPAIDPNSDYRHASTLGGAPICLAAGLAQVSQFTDDFHTHVNGLGSQLRAGAREIATKLNVPLQATGVGHLFAFHWGEAPVVDFESVLATDRLLIMQLALAMMNRGYLMRSSGNGVISATMTGDDVDGLLGALHSEILAAGLDG